MRIYRNAAGFYALEADNEKNVYSSIDQKFVRISLPQFMNMLPVDAEKNEAVLEDVTLDFSFEENEQTILSKINFLQKSPDLDFYWNSSYDFVIAMISSTRNAILNEGITQATFDFLQEGHVSNKKTDSADLDKYSFIDRDFCRDDFKEGEFDLKAIFGGRIPQSGDHIVFYSLNDYLFRDDEAQEMRRNISSFCQNFYEYHGIMIDDEQVIGEQYDSSWSVMSLTTPVNLKRFLSSKIETKRETFRRAYIVENSNISKIETIRQRLKDGQYKRVIRYANTSFASVIRYCQSGVPVEKPVEYQFATRINRYKKIIIRNVAARLSHAIYLANNHPAAGKVSINSIANALGKPRQTVYNWVKAVNTKKAISTADLMKISDHLKIINPFWIIFGGRCPAVIPTDPSGRTEIEKFENELKRFSAYALPAQTKDEAEDKKLCLEQLKKQLNSFGIELFSRPDVIKLNSGVLLLENGQYVIKESNSEKLKTIFLEADKYDVNDYLYLENSDESQAPLIRAGDYLLIRKDSRAVPLHVHMIDFNGQGRNLGYYLVTINGVPACCSVYLDVMLGFVRININSKDVGASILQAPWNDSMSERYDLIQDGRQISSVEVKFIGEIVKTDHYFDK